VVFRIRGEFKNYSFFCAHIPMEENERQKDQLYETKYSLHVPLDIECADEFIEETINIKFLFIKIDNNLNWKNHIDQILPTLGAACLTVRLLFHTKTYKF
jgi:hypothetical protein